MTAFSKNLRSVLDGSFLSAESVVKNLPYYLFLVLLGIIYIANSYYADHILNQTAQIKDEIKELRSEYVSTKSELMKKSKQSEVARIAEETGLKESTQPPGKIIYNKN